MKNIKKSIHKLGDTKQILKGLFISKSKDGFGLKQILQFLGLRKKDDVEDCKKSIEVLVREKFISKGKDGKFELSNKERCVMGKVDYVNENYAYVIPKLSDSSDIRVRACDLLGALDGDSVEVVLKDQKSRRPEGRVTKILERSRKHHVCILREEQRSLVAWPTDRRMYNPVFLKTVPPEAKVGYKVVVAIVDWDKKTNRFWGEIESTLGAAGENDVEMHSILAEFNLPSVFSEEIEKEANAITAGITSSEIIRRRDFRGVTTFTIDPRDAKDFDDALSFKKLQNGNYEIGVHVADVAHYVAEGSLIDKEAYERGCSVYLVDRTVPMLPEHLCNTLCSLRPEEEKLTMSAVFEFDAAGNILNEWFGDSVIRSDKRFVYEEAQEVLDASSGEYFFELKTLNELAKFLRENRRENGAIDFAQDEVVFELDSTGKPLNIVPKKTCDTHRLIEEFMVLANNRVAAFILNNEKNSGLIYRVHPEPEVDRLNDFYKLVKGFGYASKISVKASTCSNINGIVSASRGKADEFIIQTLAIRSMARAVYSCKEQDHFGLGLDHYSHFTSPIRRYPDMMVHRTLKKVLREKSAPVALSALEEQCRHLSQMEQIATSAERASIRYKQVEFMSLLQEKEHRGIISSVTEWGAYVELLGIRCEGLVRISDMRDDSYAFDRQKFCLIGRKTHKEYRIGQLVTIQVKSCDLVTRRMDFKFLS